MRDELLEQVGGALMSPTADASVSSSFNALATSMMLQNNGMVEDSIREILRPMLKSWLDDNLPGIVERLVRQEIERMSRGRR
jgi:cell pole-organizing protein PopZ